MDVRQLKYFLRIVTCGSISRAAVELHVAQPALSQHVTNLESELGVRLLVRSRRGVAPTDSGLRLVEHARTILSQIDRASEDVRSSGRAPTGHEVLGLTAGPAALLAAPLLTRARSRYPGITVRIIDGFSSTLVEAVRSGLADLALVIDTGDKQSIDVTPLLWEQVELFGRGIGAEPIRPAELARIPLILPSAAHAMRRLVERYARSTGIELKVLYEVDAIPAIIALLQAGVGCSLLAPSSLYAEGGRNRLDSRPSDPRIERTIAVALPEHRPTTRAVEVIREQLHTVVAERVAAGTWPARLLVRPGNDRHAQAEIETIGF